MRAHRAKVVDFSTLAGSPHELSLSFSVVGFSKHFLSFFSQLLIFFSFLLEGPNFPDGAVLVGADVQGDATPRPTEINLETIRRRRKWSKSNEMKCKTNKYTLDHTCASTLAFGGGFFSRKWVDFFSSLKGGGGGGFFEKMNIFYYINFRFFSIFNDFGGIKNPDWNSFFWGGIKKFGAWGGNPPIYPPTCARMPP